MDLSILSRNIRFRFTVLYWAIFGPVVLHWVRYFGAMKAGEWRQITPYGLTVWVEFEYPVGWLDPFVGVVFPVVCIYIVFMITLDGFKHGSKG